MFPSWITPLVGLAALFAPRLKDRLIVLRWLRQGGYVDRAQHKQQAPFGEGPTVEETVARYARDKEMVC